MLYASVPKVSLDCSGGNAGVDELIARAVAELVGVALESESSLLAQFNHDF